MTRSPLVILVTALHTGELPERIRTLAPDARLCRMEDIDREPDLLSQVEVVYGVLPPDRFHQAIRLRWLQTGFAGMEWADHEAIRRHPVVLTNARIHDIPISEHLFGMLLMLVRRLDIAYQQQTAAIWDRTHLSDDVIDVAYGKTLCVVGLGVIGTRCAALGAALGMDVIGVRRQVRPTPPCRTVYPPDCLQDALSEADVVMNLLPITRETRGMFDHRAFQAVRPGAYFLNAGRGQTVVTDALMNALRTGHLAGAGLDVTDPEPLPPDHPLWRMPRVIVSPHVSGNRPEYDAYVEAVFLDNLKRFLRGEPLQFVIDKQAGY